jgi:hypothetical protein
VTHIQDGLSTISTGSLSFALLVRTTSTTYQYLCSEKFESDNDVVLYCTVVHSSRQFSNPKPQQRHISAMSKRQTLTIAITCVAILVLLQPTACFPRASTYQQQHLPATVLFMGKNKKQTSPPKLSYAERLQQLRHKQMQEEQPDDPSLQEGSPQNLARQMVEAQRKSIDMLTFVRQRVESLPLTAIMESLETDGHVVVDDFLANEDVVSTIQAEGIALFEKDKMEKDLTRLGSGEYIVAIKGGDDQYAICPRTIETVVSITKHLTSSLPDFDLDGSNCIASMRTYDRSSRQASLALVQSQDVLIPKPFQTIADGESDGRKVTLLYYPIAPVWSDGGVTMERGELISAKRDRLILLRSDSCRHRQEYFEGHDGMQQASCLELHFLGKVRR